MCIRDRITHQKTGEPPERRIKKIRLVSVRQIQFLSGDIVFQTKTFVKAAVRKRMKILLGNIVISKQHEQAVFFIKERQQPEYIAVDILNLSLIHI